jgi:hypothetical protein
MRATAGAYAEAGAPDPAGSMQPTRTILTGGAPAKLAVPRWVVIIAAMAAQVVLARAMVQAPILGLVQAAVLAALVGYAAVTRNTILSLGLIAYLPGVEVAFRQVSAPVPYLLVPYLLIAIGVLATFTAYDQITKPGRTALLYFFLLVPSAIATISATGSGARELLAFALSGPLALAVLIVFLSQVQLETWLYRRLMWIMIISGLAPSAIALTSIGDYLSTAGAIDFSSESNFVTSGGFGPVQVSSVVGLSVLASVLVYAVEREPTMRLLSIATGTVAIVVSLLTFSRGGMTATALAVAALIISQTRDPRARRRVVTIVAVVLILGYTLLLPRLNEFTQGAFEERFTDTETSRTELAVNDFEIFQDHILFGVGPGLTKYQRLTWEVCQIRADRCKDEASSHTEFTRMLSEHGIPGLLAIVVMATLPLQAIRRSSASRPLTIAFLVWAIAQLFYANFRVSAVAVVFAFAFLRIESSAGPGQLADEPRPDAALSR